MVYNCAVRFPDLEFTAQRCKDVEHFAHLHGLFATLKFDQEAETDATGSRQFILPKPKSFTFVSYCAANRGDFDHSPLPLPEREFNEL